jgi:tetratricopeptide (TPR) repeat protein
MFNEGVELAPDEGPAYWWRGRFLFQIGNYDLSLADLDLAIQFSPVSAQPYLDRATLYMDIFEEFELARADIEEARSLGEEPRDRDILDSSDALMERLEELEAAAAAG